MNYKKITTRSLLLFFLLFSFHSIVKAQEYKSVSEVKGLPVGAEVSMFTAKDQFGNNYKLSEALEKGPVVLLFYRGQWCPVCNKHLSQLQDSLQLIYNKVTSKAEIRIRDFGVGIPSEDINKIFERYYRVEVEKSKPGLGLGLYIAQNILLSHGSRLTVQSESGKGTTFCFSLPVIQKK